MGDGKRVAMVGGERREMRACRGAECRERWFEMGSEAAMRQRAREVLRADRHSPMSDGWTRVDLVPAAVAS